MQLEKAILTTSSAIEDLKLAIGKEWLDFTVEELADEGVPMSYSLGASLADCQESIRTCSPDALDKVAAGLGVAYSYTIEAMPEGLVKAIAPQITRLVYLIMDLRCSVGISGGSVIDPKTAIATLGDIQEIIDSLGMNFSSSPQDAHTKIDYSSDKLSEVIDWLSGQEPPNE